MNNLAPIPGFPRYGITQTGRVYSWVTEKWMKPAFDKDGYHMVTVRGEDRKPKRLRIPRLVLLTYVGPPPEGKPLALHRNGDNQDNSVSNLKWGDNSENMQDRVRHGTCKNSNITECPRGHAYPPGDVVTRTTSGSRVCLICRRDDKRAQRAKGLPGDDERHGTVNGWFNFGCRCGPCCDAERVYREARRARGRGTSELFD